MNTFGEPPLLYYTMLRFNVFLYPVLLLLLSFHAFAQDRPVGFWRAHLPTNNAQGIATDGVTNYIITRKGFFTYATINGSVENFSKVEGLHDTNPVGIAYDRSTSTCVIGYESGNIDLFRYNNFKVLPDLKNKSFSGSKTIHHIYTDSGKAYLSTGLGIVVLDLAKQEVKETYVFSKGGQTLGINGFAADRQYYYAASDAGIYRIARSSIAPQVFSNWEVVDTQSAYKRIVIFKDTPYATTTGLTDSLFRITAHSPRQRVWYRDSTNFTSLDALGDVLFAGVFNTKGAGRSYHFGGPGFAILDSTFVAYPKGTVIADDGRIWVADAYQGMGRREPDAHVNYIIPGGPNDAENSDLYARNGEVWIAHGGIYGSYEGRRKTAGLSHLINDKWEILSAYSYNLFYDSVIGPV